MTPKEKAIELVEKFEPYCYHERIECALIAVDEIIEANPIKFDEDDNCIASYWWVEVKQEIEKL